jgi:hypothetical protein
MHDLVSALIETVTLLTELGVFWRGHVMLNACFTHAHGQYLMEIIVVPLPTTDIIEKRVGFELAISRYPYAPQHARPPLLNKIPACSLYVARPQLLTRPG